MSPGNGSMSILSHGEQDVAGYLREHPDASTAEIAAARGTDEAAVEQAIERIRRKTRRAVVTLSESPFAEEALSTAEPAIRTRLRAALGD